MIRILGGPKRLCDGLTRRDLLHVGSLGLLGLGASTLGLGRQASASIAPGARFGQAKSCILLFLYGSPSQLETFDPKPEAPEKIRGEFKSIASTVPGLDVCEHLPRHAQVADKFALVRSIAHHFAGHGDASPGDLPGSWIATVGPNSPGRIQAIERIDELSHFCRPQQVAGFPGCPRSYQNDGDLRGLSEMAQKAVCRDIGVDSPRAPTAISCPTPREGADRWM